MPQSLPQNDPELEARQRTRNGYIALFIFMLAALPTGGFFAYAGYVNAQPLLFVIAGILAANLIVGFWLWTLIRKDGVTQAMSFLIALFLMDVLAVPFLAQDLGLLAAALAIVVATAISGLTLPQKYKPTGVIGGALTGALAYALDALLGNDRLRVPQIQAYVPYVFAAIFVLILAVIILSFKNFRLRFKIAFGILSTGAIAILALTAFSLYRADALITTVADKFEGSIAAQIKTEISTTVQTEAQNADDVFDLTLKNLQTLAKYRENLETRKDLFVEGAYWNSTEKIIQLPGGQYGNSPTDPASIFIPSIYPPNEAMLAELNTTAYMDFTALNFLDANPQVVATYYMSALGATTYYPNISLAEQVPADFDIASQIFFIIADPQNDPERLPRWTAPYQDPAGTGLIVTLSIPVYVNNAFKGVLSADLQLAQIAESISNIKLGQTGFAFLVDQEGHILAMPEHGYTFFGLQREEVPTGESPKRSVIGIDRTLELMQVMQRIVNGESDLVEVQINGANHYVGFMPLKTAQYSLALVVPKAEMDAAITENRKNIEAQKLSALQVLSTLLAALFIVAVGISFVIGQVITNPLVRLTKIVEQIAGGDMSARAVVETQDETGRLAASVNTMNDELKNILSSLEERIAERTHELERINEINARRAAQFETVARIARTISATQTLDTLLPQIVETISKQFNFYHVGIFLLDNRHEYAILVAANSEGGQKMLARNHRLLVGEIGIVGYVTSVGQPRVALDVGADATYFNNPDLPNTHSEIALPLRIGADIFGALDVQSTEGNAFSEEDISILSTLADQVSIAIQNARSFQQSREALAQAERVSFQLSGQQWSHFIEQQTITGYHFDGTDTKAVTPEQKQRAHNLSIPLTMRGARIGAIKINASDPNHQWTDDELAMVQAAADRAALALENARLLEESQKRATKERTIGDISAKIGGASDLEDIIQTAIQELGNTLPDMDIAIQFTDAPARQ